MTRDAEDRDGGGWLSLLAAGVIAVVAAIGYLIYSGAASSQAVKMAVNLPRPPAIQSPAPTPAPLAKPAG